MSHEEMITIPKSVFYSLRTAEAFLDRLFAAGVDNWSGMEYVDKVFDEVWSDEKKRIYAEIYGETATKDPLDASTF